MFTFDGLMIKVQVLRCVFAGGPDGFSTQAKQNAAYLWRLSA